LKTFEMLFQGQPVAGFLKTYSENLDITLPLDFGPFRMQLYY